MARPDASSSSNSSDGSIGDVSSLGGVADSDVSLEHEARVSPTLASARARALSARRSDLLLAPPALRQPATALARGADADPSHRLRHLKTHMKQLRRLYDEQVHLEELGARDAFVQAICTASITLFRHCASRNRFFTAVRALMCQYAPSTAAKLLQVEQSSNGCYLVLQSGRSFEVAPVGGVSGIAGNAVHAAVTMSGRSLTREATGSSGLDASSASSLTPTEQETEPGIHVEIDLAVRKRGDANAHLLVLVLKNALGHPIGVVEAMLPDKFACNTEFLDAFGVLLAAALESSEFAARLSQARQCNDRGEQLDSGVQIRVLFRGETKEVFSQVYSGLGAAVAAGSSGVPAENENAGSLDELVLTANTLSVTNEELAAEQAFERKATDHERRHRECLNRWTGFVEKWSSMQLRDWRAWKESATLLLHGLLPSSDYFVNLLCSSGGPDDASELQAALDILEDVRCPPHSSNVLNVLNQALLPTCMAFPLQAEEHGADEDAWYTESRVVVHRRAESEAARDLGDQLQPLHPTSSVFTRALAASNEGIEVQGRIDIAWNPQESALPPDLVLTMFEWVGDTLESLLRQWSSNGRWGLLEADAPWTRLFDVMQAFQSPAYKLIRERAKLTQQTRAASLARQEVEQLQRIVDGLRAQLQQDSHSHSELSTRLGDHERIVAANQLLEARLVEVSAQTEALVRECGERQQELAAREKAVVKLNVQLENCADLETQVQLAADENDALRRRERRLERKVLKQRVQLQQLVAETGALKQKEEFDRHEVAQLQRQLAVLVEKQKHVEATKRPSQRSQTTNRHVQQLQHQSQKWQQVNLVQELRQLTAMEVREMRARSHEQREKSWRLQTADSAIEKCPEPLSVGSNVRRYALKLTLDQYTCSAYANGAFTVLFATVPPELFPHPLAKSVWLHDNLIFTLPADVTVTLTLLRIRVASMDLWMEAFPAWISA
ncbi:hypothetical protein PybrP1_013109, partial [[Pythium] brassicae (nom. inval.)]